MACPLNLSALAICPNPHPSSHPSSFSYLPSSVSPPKLRSLLPSSISATPVRLLRLDGTLFWIGTQRNPTHIASKSPAVVSSHKPEPLKVMISGAPASGKGTQCEFIAKKYGLVHIAAGDLLRTEVAAGSENGKCAKEYMEKGQLVPDEIVVMMVKDRLSQKDSKENGWLLDGYPRSLSQALALKNLGYQPDLFICLDVPEEILVERVMGRRLDPLTRRIYHLKYFPPETEEIAARLVQRFDDTEEKVKLRLQTHHQNVEQVLALYQDTCLKVDGSASREAVSAHIDAALTQQLVHKKEAHMINVLMC